MQRLFSSVRVRLTAAVTAAFAVAFVIGAFGLVHQVRSALTEDVRDRNRLAADSIARMVASDGAISDLLTRSVNDVAPDLVDGGDPTLMRETISQSYVYVTGPIEAEDQDQSVWDRLRAAASSSTHPLFGQDVPEQLPKDQYFISLRPLRTANGEAVLHVASSLSGVNRTVARMGGVLVFAVPLLVAMVGCAAWFMTGQALRPVVAITKRAKEITGSTLYERVPVPPTDDEVGELARTMNAMLDRLEGAAVSQKRFMSDASHELRSPVASIQTQIETALLAGDSTDWPSVARTVLNEDLRLESLVSNLLAMTRLEEGVRPQLTEVYLDEVIYEQTARPVPVTVDRSRVGTARVFGVPQEVGSVVRNLFDNAVRHASTRVSLSLSVVGPWIRLSVEDDGPGVAPEDREKIFERFARLQEGRARDSGGSGLGLALSRRIVENYGGRLFVETSSLGGAAFVAELPAIPDVEGFDDEPEILD